MPAYEYVTGRNHAMRHGARLRFISESLMTKCETMVDVRREVDRLDRELVKLLTQRQAMMNEAGRIKQSRDLVRDEPRIEQVVSNVLAEAEKSGLSPAIAEPVWRLLIEKSIEHELGVFDELEASSTKKS
jgi:isochorismate pyruvate lyase